MPHFSQNARRDVPAYQRIEESLRLEILSGRLAYGSRLPAAQELAAQYGTSVFTIHSALSPLVAEGLLERAPRRGTIIRGGKNQLTQVGLYYGSNFLHGAGKAFYHKLSEELEKELNLERIRRHVWIDTRAEEEQKEPPPELAEAVSRRKIQALIGISLNPVDARWIGQLSLPVAAASTAQLPGRVGQDYSQMAQTAMQALHEQGCRSVGFILPRPVWGPEESDRIEDIAGLFPYIVEEAGRLGLQIRNSWMRTPPRRLSDSSLEEFGFRQFLELWRQPEKPDGLVVIPDTVVRGVITAILHEGVQVARDIKLVLHRNEGIPVLCPFPASWLVTNVRQWAVALVEQLKHQIAGRQVQPLYLPAFLNPTTSLPNK